MSENIKKFNSRIRSVNEERKKRGAVALEQPEEVADELNKRLRPEKVPVGVISGVSLEEAKEADLID